MRLVFNFIKDVFVIVFVLYNSVIWMTKGDSVRDSGVSF